MDALLKWLVVAVLAAHPPDKPPPRPEGQSLRAMATSAALAHHLPPSLVHRLVEIESGWRVSAFKYEARLREGSVGLMQVLPSTAKLPAAALFKPEVNLAAGCRELARCLRLTAGNVRRALVCYNGGAGCLKKRCQSAEKYAAGLLNIHLNKYRRENPHLPRLLTR